MRSQPLSSTSTQRTPAREQPNACQASASEWIVTKTFHGSAPSALTSNALNCSLLIIVIARSVAVRCTVRCGQDPSIGLVGIHFSRVVSSEPTRFSVDRQRPVSLSLEWVRRVANLKGIEAWPQVPCSCRPLRGKDGNMPWDQCCLLFGDTTRSRWKDEQRSVQDATLS